MAGLKSVSRACRDRTPPSLTSSHLTVLLLILIFVAIMSLVRFIGSTAYVIDRAVRTVGGRIVSHFGTRKIPTEKGSTGGRVSGRRAGRGVGSESESEREKREIEEEEVVELSAEGSRR